MSLEEIQKRLKNEKIGQALYVNNIEFYREEKDLSELCEHKQDKWTKTIDEREIYSPKSNKRVFYKGDFREKNPSQLIVLSSQEIYDLIHKNISIIIRNKFKI